jgi:hypothetical protein
VTLSPALGRELLDLLRLHEAYQQARDVEQTARQFRPLRSSAASPLTRETIRLRVILEEMLADAGVG